MTNQNNLPEEVIAKLDSLHGSNRVMEEILLGIGNHIVEGRPSYEQELMFFCHNINTRLVNDYGQDRMKNYFIWLLANVRDQDWQAVLDPFKILIRNDKAIKNIILLTPEWISIARKMKEHTDLFSDSHYTTHRF